MRALILPVLLMTLLSACQSRNPYTAESAPLPPPPASAATTFDRSAYPAAPRDYGRYRSWVWRDGHPPAGNAWLGGEQVGESVGAGLDQHGLRPAHDGRQADLQVSARLDVETRQRQYYDDSGAYYGGGYRDRYGAWGGPPRLRTYEEQVTVVRVDFFDARSGERIWSGAGEARAGGDRGDRAEAVRNAVAAALRGYPPN